MSPHVMVVDDDAGCRRLFGDRLELIGCEVERVASGAAALASARQRWPALVLMDVCMPGLDGIETLRQLREIQAGRPLAVLVITASPMNDDKMQRLEAVGYDRLFAKPLEHVSQLTQAATEHLQWPQALPPAPSPSG